MSLPSSARCARAALSRWTHGALCALICAAAASAQTADGASATTETSPRASVRAETDAEQNLGPSTRTPQSRFDLLVQAPGPLSDFLLRHLDIQRFRQQRSLDAAELSRLLAELPANARQLLATQGYFAPRIEVDAPVPSADPGPAQANDAAPSLGRVAVRVDPGPATRVTRVEVIFQGAIQDSADAAQQRDEIQREAAMVTDQVFTQAAWDRTKTAALRRLTAQRFPAGRIATSLADVDGSQHTARLYIELDSGPLQRMGRIEVEGAQRYDPVIAERIVRLSEVELGSIYDLGHLQQAQQRLLDSGYFDAAFVYVEPSPDQTLLPVRVQVREAQRQKWVLGLGGSTDNGARVSVEHTHNRVPGLDWRAQTTLRFERQDSLASTEWSSIPDDDGWRWVTGARGLRQQDGVLTTTSQRWGIGRTQDGVELDRSLYLQYDRARTTDALLALPGDGQLESSLTFNYAWSRQRFDDLIGPQRGYGLAVELGAGSTLGIERKPFGRGVLRWQGFFPLDDPSERLTPVPGQANRQARPSPKGRLVIRLAGGAVVAGDDAPVPDTQLFLTGGDETVRGYALRSIGIAQSDGSVRAGRFLASTSLEWQRPVWADAQGRTPIEQVFFVDGGAVSNRVRDLDFQWGVGTGLRYNSPVGPLQVDLAYGLETRRLRLHLRVGFAF